MVDIKIDKGVPMPRSASYPFDAMEVGDSFCIAGGPEDEAYIVSALSALSEGDPARARRFTALREGEGEATRIWRIE